MKSFFLTLVIAASATGSGFAQDASNDQKVHRARVEVPACYERELDALEGALAQIKEKAEVTCKKEGLEGLIDKISVNRNTACHGFVVSATFYCLKAAVIN